MTHEEAKAAILDREQEKGVVSEAELRQQLADVTNERDGLCITIRQLQVKHSVERDAIQLQLNASEALLKTAASYVSDLASSLGNACEDFEGDESEDPQAREECSEAREFADEIRAFLARSAPATDEQGARS